MLKTDMFLGEDTASIKLSVIQFLDGDTCFGVSVHDGMLNGCCSSVLWQERGMDIDSTVL